MTESPLPANNMAEATLEAVRRARARLMGADLALAATRGGLARDPDGTISVPFLGRLLRVIPGSLAVEAADGKPVSASDEGLVLRYLESEREVTPLGESITFRDLPGGKFYCGPVENRTSNLLLKVFGNDMDRLKAAMARYPFDLVELGDLGFQVHALGRLDVTLVYRLGDEEFPPTLDLLYDRIIASVLHTDEVAALATRLCTGLLKPV